MEREKKREFVSDLKAGIQGSAFLLVLKQEGVDVSSFERFRADVRQAGGGLRVTKKTLGRLAVRETEHESVMPFLKGPLLFVFGQEAVDLARAAHEFGKEVKGLDIVAGALDGVFLRKEDIVELASLPPLPVLRSDFVKALASPLMGVVRSLALSSLALVRALEARAKALK